MKTAVFFGSTGGNTADAANRIRSVMRHHHPVHLYDIRECDDVMVFAPYDLILLGTSTWGNGELQVDWERFYPKLDSVSLEGKKIGLFGLGDQKYFGHVFVDALRLLHDKVLECGAEVIGLWPDEGYVYDQSRAVIEGRFVGLVLDEDNQEELTDQRIRKWCTQVRLELSAKCAFELCKE